MSEKMLTFDEWFRDEYPEDCAQIKMAQEGAIPHIEAITSRHKKVNMEVAWQAALRTHENGGKESEVLADLKIPFRAKRVEVKFFDSEGWEILIGEGAGIETTGYLAPPEMQESEAGAVMVGYIPSEVMEELVKENSVTCGILRRKFGVYDTAIYLAPPSAQAIEAAAIMKCMEKVNEWVNPYNDNAAAQIVLALEALIPQDGRTQLEEFGMKVAQEVKSATVFNECRNMLTKENELRAIVTNLIGVPPLNSESVRGEGK